MLVIKRPNNRVKQDDTLINGKVRFPEVRLLSSTGEQLGLMSSKEAATLAFNEDLDLVCISPKSNPPVCKIMDYAKYKYEQQRKKREAKKNQKTTQLKEIRLSPTIEQHDFNTKLKNAIKFLTKENKVKVSIRFRGRMIAHKNLGREQLEKFATAANEYATVESRPKMEGRQMFMTLTPIKK